MSSRRPDVGVWPSRLGQTEIQQLDVVVRRDLHVARFQIAMDDALFVRRFERLRDLLRDAQGLFLWES